MSDQQCARDALRALGIQKPSPQLIENWIRANRAAEAQESALAGQAVIPLPTPPPAQPKGENFRPKHPRGYSKSNLEPTLRSQGTLQQQHELRRPGRPRVVASWFPAVAKTVADGTPLREALKKHGVTLNKAQIRALYRNEEFKRLRLEGAGQARAGKKRGRSH